MVIVLQHFGIGDVIFSQTAIRSMYSNKDIRWPVLPGYVEGLNRAYPDIQFVDSGGYEQILETKEFTFTPSYNEIVPLRWSYEIIKAPFWQCMMSKYMLFGLDWNTWKEKAMWKRDISKEMELFRYLGLNELDKFALVNSTFGADFSGKARIVPPKGIKIINMQQIPGYSLFDWTYIIQKASVIHTVSTSIIYLLEMLALNASSIHVYIRRPHEANHKNYDYILQSHNYILHP